MTSQSPQQSKLSPQQPATVTNQAVPQQATVTAVSAKTATVLVETQLLVVAAAMKQEARKEAARRVRDALGSPGGIERLDQLRSSAAQYRSSLESQLKGSVESQLTDASQALDALLKSREVVGHVRESLSGIDQLCQSCKALISEEEYAVIKRLARVRDNVVSTLSEIRRVQEIPAKIAEIRELLGQEQSQDFLLSLSSVDHYI